MELSKASNFYIFLAILLLIVGGVLVITFRSIFASLGKSSEIEHGINDVELRVNKALLNQAYNLYLNREFSQYDFRLESTQSAQLAE